MENTNTQSLDNVGIERFFGLSVPKLKDFIHVWRFVTKTFQESKLVVNGKKLNKTLYKGQTVEMMKEECSPEEPCLVWYAWTIRGEEVVLKCPSLPKLDTSIPTPTFEVTSSVLVNERRPSEYLQDEQWLKALKGTVKGVRLVEVTERRVHESDILAKVLEQRLDLHISARVHPSKHHHWTMYFVRDNLAPMAAAMMLTGHVLGHLETNNISEKLLDLPFGDPSAFSDMAGVAPELLDLEGCYLYFDGVKKKWVRSGKTSGLGKAATFRGRGEQHVKNSRSLDQMKMHDFYRIYPAEGVRNLGGVGGHFGFLKMYCAMAFDRKEDVAPLCSEGESSSLFVWSREALARLAKEDGNLRNRQLDAVAYLWELCYDLVLAASDNVSQSPGFESFGLRNN